MMVIIFWRCLDPKHVQNVEVGQDIRPVGSDICEGEVVLGCGALMGPGEVRANIANICKYC